MPGAGERDRVAAEAAGRVEHVERVAEREQARERCDVLLAALEGRPRAVRLQVEPVEDRVPVAGQLTLRSSDSACWFQGTRWVIPAAPVRPRFSRYQSYVRISVSSLEN